MFIMLRFAILVVGVIFFVGSEAVHFIKPQLQEEANYIPDCDKDLTERCAIPANVFRYKGWGRRFEPYCRAFDACNSCGIKYGADEEECAKRFEESLEKFCRKDKLCNHYAALYYEVTVEDADYQNKGSDFCGQDWVEGCIAEQVNEKRFALEQ